MFRQDCIEIKNFSMGSDKFKDSGCAICAIAHIAEQLNGKCYTPREIQSKCIDLLSYGILKENFFVADWNRLLNAFGVIGTFRKEGADYICGDNEEEILRLSKPGYEHFVAGDGTGHYSFDSLGRRKSQKDYQIKNKWIISVHDVM